MDKFNYDAGTCQLPFFIEAELNEKRREVGRLSNLRVSALLLADQIEKDLNNAIISARTVTGYAVQREYLDPLAHLAAADKQATEGGNSCIRPYELDAIHTPLKTTDDIVEVWQESPEVLEETRHLLIKYEKAINTEPRESDDGLNYAPVIAAMREANNQEVK